MPDFHKLMSEDICSFKSAIILQLLVWTDFFFYYLGSSSETKMEIKMERNTKAEVNSQPANKHLFYIFRRNLRFRNIQKTELGNKVQSMDSSARILSQKRVLVKNLERFPCRLANRIIVLNVFQISLPLTVIASSVSFEHVGSLPPGCNMLLGLSSLFHLFIFLVERRQFFCHD